MRVFEITSGKFAGKVEVRFGDDDRFAGILFDKAHLSIEQVQWFMNHIPANARSMGLFAGQVTVVEICEQIDFKAFWDRYNDKARSSRVKTERAWKRMSRKDQVQAYSYVPKYFASIPQGVMKKYATTYLNDQLWNN